MTAAIAASRSIQPPDDLRGRPGPDRMFRALLPLASAFEWISKRGERKQPPVRAVDRALRLVVDAVVTEADDVVSLRLTDPDGRALPRWQPGAHLDLVLPSGTRRQYSLCGDPADVFAYRVAVRRIDGGGGGSVEVHSLTAGTHVVVQGPRNAFPYVDRGPYLFVAGGIGITPILPMVRDAARRGADWRLVYTGRSRSSMPFLEELASLRTTDRVVVRPDDEFGVPDAAELLAHAPRGASLYCCGPSPMIDAVRAAFGPGRLHTERFSPPPVVGGVPFEIQLGEGGQVVEVPADRSALSVVREARAGTRYSCQQGFCGTCEVRVRGPVVHSGRPVADGSMLLCVSRSTGERLVLDVSGEVER